jgi:glutaredoxin 3
MSDVRIYTIRGCGFCARAKRLLQARGIPFQEIDVTTDGQARAWLRTATGKSTVPQTFVNGRPVGGATDLEALDKMGQLGRVMSGR